MISLLLALFLQVRQPPTCTGNLDTPGCKSFREMVVKQDHEMMNLIKAPSAAYVCFTPKIDEFTVISFDHPEGVDFEQDAKNKYIWTAAGLADISTYVDGVANYSNTIFGTWTAYGKDFKAARFDTPAQNVDGKASSVNDAALKIDPSEIDAFFSYKNSSNEAVTISIKIRRSTGRFQKTFQFPVSGKDMSTTETGYCTEYR